MKGRNSTVISLRVDDSVYTMLERLATKKGMTVNAFVKSKLEDFVKRVNTINGSHSVYTTKTPQLYDPATHKPGDKVLIRRGKRLVEAIVPDIDADGYLVYSD